jgi:hypothetical protein
MIAPEDMHAGRATRGRSMDGPEMILYMKLPSRGIDGARE